LGVFNFIFNPFGIDEIDPKNDQDNSRGKGQKKADNPTENDQTA
jgi:hypothetical protein